MTFGDALDSIEDSADYAPLAAILNASSTLTVNAAGAAGNLDMWELWDNVADLVTQPVSITGSTHDDDELFGGTGNDTIAVGAGESIEIEGTTGNDTIDFTNSNGNSYARLDYEDRVSGALTFNLDGGANTGSVLGVGFTDTLLNVSNVLQADGLAIEGDSGNDTFNVRVVSSDWTALTGNEGNDTFNLTFDGGTVRLDYRWGGNGNPTQGLVVNLNTGVVSNDGFGDTDQINASGSSGRLEIRGTANADSILGSGADERFILELGSDTLDGGGGWDILRYDRSGVGPVSVDLLAGTITGTWDGTGFSHAVSNIEEVRGSREDNDTLLGSNSDDYFNGRGGDDLMDGRNGDDTLRGEDGNDTLRGGNGTDQLRGGDGNDLLDASTGTAASQGWGDYIRPGLGQDTITGHSGLWAIDEGIDLSYADVSGVNGVTISVGANGSGTAVSGDGRVNDTFTYSHYFEGSADNDSITGSNEDRWEGFSGLEGDDTINGRSGWDRVDYSYEEGYGGSAVGISGNLNTGQVTDTFGDTDTLINIDQVRGTDYDDVLTAAGLTRGIRFEGEAGADSLTGGASDDRLEGDDGNDTLNGGSGADSLEGGAGADRADAGVGNDSVEGGSGDDSLLGGGGFDTLLGGADSDTLDGGNGADSLEGGSGADLLLGGAGFDNLHGDAGNDTLSGGSTADRLYGGDDNDVLRGGSNVGLTKDGLFGEAGDDTLFGEGGFDVLDGGTGDDSLDGGDQADNLYGGTGNDTLLGGNGLDRLFGGADDDFGQGGAGNDGLFGQQGNDSLEGEAGNDRFFGGTGNDSLLGGADNDTLYGGAGFDTLEGGAGNDTLQGDFNADRFVFSDGHGVDVITDFAALNIYERIDLAGVSAIDDLSDLLSNHASQSGSDVLIDTGSGNSITLQNVLLADLDATDFMF